MDKTKAVIEYLLTCPGLQNSPLYFNFVEASDADKQFITMGNDKILDKPFIDGSVQKRFTFTIVDYRSVAYQELPKLFLSTNENLEEYLDVQTIIDWVTEQNLIHNFPNFGEKCIIDSIATTTDNPNLNGVDNHINPALAKYSMSIMIDYLDISQRIY